MTVIQQTGKGDRMSSIYEIYGKDAHEMTKRLMAAAKVANRIPDGAKIVIKPNLVSASRAENGATTHPGAVSGCIEYLQDAGFGDISVIEGSWVGERTENAVRVCGYDRICNKYNVPFHDLKKDSTKRVDTPLRPMEISSLAADADYFIDMPVLKGHCQTVMTCALKNLKGCIPDHEKRRFHADGLIKPIAALSSVLKPDLVIVDSICGDLNFEDGGNPVQTNRMMLGFDALQMDSYCLNLMGLDVSDVPYISLAEKWGAGNSRIEPDDIVKLNEAEESEEFPKVSGKVKDLVKNVSSNGACSACYASLVRALYIAQRSGKRINEKIFIGQGYQGKTIDGTGIGRCCRGAGRCIMGCPPSAKDILKILL